MKTFDPARLLQIGLAGVPACLGIFAFINNVTDWSGTVENVLTPLFSMTDNHQPYSSQSWRAIGGQFFPNLAYGIVTALETLMGLIAAYGAVGMIRCYNNPGLEFRKFKHIVCMACMLGAFIYCFVFYTVGGDWFLAWKSSNLGYIQTSSLNYALALTVVFLFLRFCEDEDTRQ